MKQISIIAIVVLSFVGFINAAPKGIKDTLQKMVSLDDAIDYGVAEIAKDFNFDTSDQAKINRAVKDGIRYVRTGKTSFLDDEEKAAQDLDKGLTFNVGDITSGKVDPITAYINTLVQEVMRKNKDQKDPQALKAAIEKDGINDAIKSAKVAKDYKLSSAQQADIAEAEKNIIKYIRKGTKVNLDDAEKAVKDINAKGADLDVDGILKGKIDPITAYINALADKLKNKQ
ncbi:hypothetical protein CEXT_314601 [Caerostris extrusa]|uniref:Uncharacterized protein n=1 Tax=Caerostris extrusa TaxID=172846 RepID=A0AAV4TPL5_CAEEX|nr:hypothetical protein CEXT_314601 [Caerostris extrusa]